MNHRANITNPDEVYFVQYLSKINTTSNRIATRELVTINGQDYNIIDLDEDDD